MFQMRRFTGYHATAMISLFFAVVIAVNVLMATFAVRTFGGTVVENSYVASQHFNGWLEEARREARLAWSVDQPVRDTADRLSIGARDAQSRPLATARVSAHAVHPLGRMPERRLTFTEVAPGAYRSVEGLPPGRWKLWVRIEKGDSHFDKWFDIS